MDKTYTYQTILYIINLFVFIALFSCDTSVFRAKVVTIADSTTVQIVIEDKIALSQKDFYKKVNDNKTYKYERNLLNSTINIKRYVSDTTVYKSKLAANLGVYLSDFTYAIVNNAEGDIVSFLKGIQKMNRAIQTKVDLDSSFITRTEINIEKKDSLLNISTQVFLKLDEALRRSEQNDLAIAMLAGAWVENMYHKLTIIERYQPDSLSNFTPKNLEVLQEVLVQKISLENLQELFKVISKKQKLGALKYGVNIILKSFETLNLKSIETKSKNFVEVPVINKSGELVLKKFKKQDISMDLLAELRRKITAVRFEIIK